LFILSQYVVKQAHFIKINKLVASWTDMAIGV